jgi:hypothetical protein
MRKLNDFMLKHLPVLIFSLAGAIGGFLYWKFIGCRTGTCPIKSVWYLSTLWGLALGYLAGGIIEDILKKIRTRREG